MIFYDFEVFKDDWLVVCIIPEISEVKVIVNDRDMMNEYYTQHKEDIWVGFNSQYYDQYILKGILLDMNPKEINDYIIEKNEPGWKYSNLFKTIKLYNYDVMLRGDGGLKKFEGMMGNSIKESDVDFRINRKLTQEEIDETIKYCTHDVMNTIQVFLERKSDFDVMMFFIKHFNLPLTDISKTKAQLSAKLLGGNRKGTRKDQFDFPILHFIKLGKYQYVADWYKNPENHSYDKFQEHYIAGVPHINSWGGGHGAIPKYHDKGIFLLIDVTAYYPSIQTKFEFGKRVMNKWENFMFIHNSNIEFKRKGDKKARMPFKILDNAIGGQMKQESSAIFDPMSNNAMVVNGQLMLIDLIEKIEPYAKLVQNNTDGIVIKLKSYDDFDLIDDIVYEWEQRTGMEMEFETFIGEIYQKDVNNYLIVDRETKSVKRKGGYVKQLSNIDNDLPIINKAVVDFMVEGIPVETTIMNCDDLKQFQMIKKISSKYKHIKHGDTILKERCIRCFASKSIWDGGLSIMHVNKDKYDKLSNTPDNAFIFNDDVNGVKSPVKLDKKWYVDVARKRLEAFGL